MSAGAGACNKATTAIDRYLLQTPALSSKPARCCCYCRSKGQTDGWTDGRTDAETPDRYISYGKRQPTFC